MAEEINILIAEDDPVSRQILQKTLEQWDYSVLTVNNGTDAWELINQDNPPRLLILDWVMPGMDGPEICRKVRGQKDDYYTYILLLTANAEIDQVIIGLEAGADDYLVKPYNPVELKARISNGARIIAMQHELIRTRDELKIQATHDNLTGLWNRATIFELLEMELAREARDLSPLGVLMIDLDDFKEINDTHGHLIGDQILAEFANRLNESVRSYDLVGRYGGDEFMIVLPKCSVEQAINLANRVVKHIEAYPIETDAGPLNISASVGVTATAGDDQVQQDHLVSRADQALYQAKKNPLDRVAFLPLQ
jgi:two-component system, cell cycle response regulator